MKLELAVLIPDSHVPYQDKKAFKLLKKVLKYYSSQISELVLMGDFGDYYAINGHGKHPQLQHLLVDEIDAINKELDWFDKELPKAKKIFLEGNHEFRLERYIAANCRELFNVTESRTLLKMDSRPKWKFIPYGPNQKHKVLGSYLMARHEPLGTSAKATASKALCSLAYGHIHRIEESHVVGMDGTNHIAFSFGWLGDKKLDKVFGYVKQHHQWQLGFCMVWVCPKTKYFYHQKVQILDNYTCVINGKMFSL